MASSSSLPRRGVIIGKFLPPHLGHFHLIASAARQVQELTVLVCTLKRECIPGRLRYEWLREMCEELGPGVRVLHSDSEVPQEPHEDPNFYAIWREKIYAEAPPPLDLLFSSEEYGWPLARALGCEHRPVDIGRVTIPVSATKIRTEPAKHWAFVPVSVRPWMVKRVLLYGPESTGKTTMAARLAQHYNTVWAPEWARLLLEKRNPQVVVAEDLPVIPREHLKLEDSLARQSGPVMFIDSDPITTSIYANHFFGYCPAHIPLLGDKRHYHARLLFTPEVAWVQDGQRDSEAGRNQLYRAFKQELERRNFPYTLIHGSDYESRFQQCVAVVDKLLQQPWEPLPEDAFLTADEAEARVAASTST